MIVLILGVLMRTVALDAVPGIHGDECYGAIFTQEVLSGKIPTSIYIGFSYINPFFYALHGLTHLLFQPSTLTLRLVAVAMGAVFLLVFYGIFRKTTDRLLVVLSLFVLLTHPTLIAHSRIAMGYCLMPLVTLLLTDAIYERRLMAVLLYFFIAFLTHVSSMALLIMATIAVFPELKTWIEQKQWKKILLAGALLITALILVFPYIPLHSFRFIRWSEIGSRIYDIFEMKAFFVHYLGMFTGATTFSLLSGYQSVLYNGISGLLWLVLAAGIGMKIIRGQTTKLKALTLGYVATVLITYLLIGASAIAPATSRYALFLVAPVFFIVGAVLKEAKRGLFPALLLCIVLFQSLGWYFGFWQPLTNSDVADRFRNQYEHHGLFATGREDFKKQALDLILDKRDPRTNAIVVAEHAFIYYPLRYLGGGAKNLWFTILSVPGYPHSYPNRYHSRMYPDDFLTAQKLLGGGEKKDVFLVLDGKAVREHYKLPSINVPVFEEQYAVYDDRNREMLVIYKIHQ